ncbi:hypothetical protein [Ligilactobacillus acidipiscis]|jgi:hypothetical protein|uniref:Uncharacterized protein n=2 Tax=Ligilactobacillus acidipiscis TaxID=89059 RepID=A0A1K1KLH2_9LACO|nr:hypothetical protein [Ligilactobacillus acidipiscis]MCI1925358.1 hypothetical protein [Ligilactobacillus acidipiscis]MCI1954629.1 hypothetical protein [Ligilactobacillus acidipiscis]SFV39726.1 hypothetical protein LAC1533_0306 [Ligilactobacillus acidipiscis]GAW64266.1 hypothetical protein Lacidipiscis_01458 [Ligilactobacillus acidipiscis]GEN20183.1 hypothetical protein LAC02_34640 [Ligilactobacillus acidipiscis]
MDEKKEDVPPRLLDDFADYCLYLSSNNVIEQRFSMEHFVNSGLTDRSFSLDQLQVKQLENLVARHKSSDHFQAKIIKNEIEHRFLKN